MGFSEQAALRPQMVFAWAKAVVKPGFITALAAIVIAVAGIATPANSRQVGNMSTSSAFVVGNDRGGFIRDRLRELSNLRKSGRRVEIRGNICYSTCTMLLGLPQTCISPETTFGFHGPSKMGKRLDAKDFDYFSKVIAQYYPAPLQSWYMTTGRNRINGMHRIRGAEIIRMGVQAC
jgi:hypothetical protein